VRLFFCRTVKQNFIMSLFHYGILMKNCTMMSLYYKLLMPINRLLVNFKFGLLLCRKLTSDFIWRSHLASFVINCQRRKRLSIVCKRICNTLVSTSQALLAHELSSPEFKKHTKSIGSKLLHHMGYIGGGLDKHGWSIIDPIVPDMRSMRADVVYVGTSFSSSPYLTTTFVL
jgi:hypothetical protein